MPDPLVLADDVESELVERRSRFLTRLHRVESPEQAEEHLRSARAAHPDARHHCSALVISPGPNRPVVHRSSDDGEPSGTAGMPMMQALLHAELTDTLAIVTRYFGGVKLGAGGLVRAYTAAVEQAVAAATLLRRTDLAVVRLEVPHAEVGIAEHALRLWAQTSGAVVEDTTYGARAATLTVLTDPATIDSLVADVARWSAGRFTPEQDGTRRADVPRDTGA